MQRVAAGELVFAECCVACIFQAIGTVKTLLHLQIHFIEVVAVHGGSMTAAAPAGPVRMADLTAAAGACSRAGSCAAHGGRREA